MVKEFKEFLLRGNLLDLAVAVVIGAAFTGVVNAFVSNLITPLIKAIFGGSTQFNSLAFTINGSRITYGNFLDAVLSFVIVALVIFFLVIISASSRFGDALGQSSTAIEPFGLAVASAVGFFGSILLHVQGVASRVARRLGASPSRPARIWSCWMTLATT